MYIYTFHFGRTFLYFDIECVLVYMCNPPQEKIKRINPTGKSSRVKIILLLINSINYSDDPFLPNHTIISDKTSLFSVNARHQSSNNTPIYPHVSITRTIIRITPIVPDFPLLTVLNPPRKFRVIIRVIYIRAHLHSLSRLPLATLNLVQFGAERFEAKAVLGDGRRPSSRPSCSVRSKIGPGEVEEEEAAKRERERERERGRERERERERERDRDREKQRETERDRERHRETKRDRERQRDTERHRERQREAERDRERQRET